MIFLIAAFGCDHVNASKDPPGDGASSGVDTHDEDAAVDEPARPDAGDATGAGGAAGSGGTECHGGLADVGRECPATFDGAPENVPACRQAQVGAQQVWSCGEFVALSLGTGAHSVDCYYDTSAYLLVGAMDVNDTNTFCGNSFTKTAGQVPPLACRYPVAMPTLYRLCTGN